MLTLAIVLRIVALLAFAGLMLLSVSWCRGQAKTRARQDRGDRAPLVANLTAFGLFFLSLLIFSSSPAGFTALLLALSGSVLALAGAASSDAVPSLVPLGASRPKQIRAPASSQPALIASCDTPSIWALHCSSWAKRSPSAAGRLSLLRCRGSSRPWPGAPARRRNCSAVHLASATRSIDVEPT
jgi:hypothetical protein